MHDSGKRCSVKERGPWRHALALLVVLTLAGGCSTTGAAGPGPMSSGGLPPDVDAEVLEAGAVAEATLALSRMWSVVGGVREVGTRLSFTFWSEQGALTLTGYAASGRGGPAGQDVDEEEVQEQLATVLTRFAQQHTGEVVVSLQRHEAGWTVEYTTSSTLPRPPEAKTLPVRRAGLPVEVVQTITQGAGHLLRAVQVPGGGEALVEVEAHLEDGRAEDWALRLFEVTREGTGEAPRLLAPHVTEEATAVLLPFTQGVGERTVRLRLRLLAPRNGRQAGGWVEAVSVVRPPPPPGLSPGFAAEYRAIHEDILRRWREDTREGAEWLARCSAEYLAVWYAGAIVARGLGWLGARVAPTVLRALQRGKEAAAGWLRTTLTRLPVDKKRTFERLWTKVQLEGKDALSQGEREELRELMQGIERLIHTPLTDKAKKNLREKARAAYSELRPEFAQVLKTQGPDLPVHHRRPLEHAHLFPEEDINAADNLIMMTREAHERINALWGKFARARPHATAQDVETATRAIDARFHPWYHQPGPLTQAPLSVREAEQRALEHLRRLFPGLE